MKIAYINPFVAAATNVLKKETKGEVKRGPLSVSSESVTCDEITALVSVAGDIYGMVMYSMSERTAKGIVSRMTGEPVPVFDQLAQSAIGEMGNVITGIASSSLEEAGYACRIAPPTLIMGRGVYISTVQLQRLVIPIETEVGDLTISVALNEG